MLMLDLEIQNYMYFIVDRSQRRYDENECCMILLALTLVLEMFWILNVTF
jgi:hypothetical protein